MLKWKTQQLIYLHLATIFSLNILKYFVNIHNTSCLLFFFGECDIFTFTSPFSWFLFHHMYCCISLHNCHTLILMIAALFLPDFWIIYNCAEGLPKILGSFLAAHRTMCGDGLVLGKHPIHSTIAMAPSHNFFLEKLH